MHRNLALGALAGWLALASQAAALAPYASLGVPEYLDTFTGESAVSTLTPDVAGGLQRLREFQASRETPTPILISSGSAKFTLGTSSPTYEPPPILAEQSILSVSAAPAAGATLVGVQAKFSGATLFTIGDYASDIGVMLAQTGGTQYAGAVLALRGMGNSLVIAWAASPTPGSSQVALPPGHTIGFTKVYDSRFGGYHEASGSLTVMEQMPKVAQKRGSVTFYIAASFSSASVVDAKLAGTQ